MVHTIRRFQQPLMIFVTVIIIIAFTWFYSRNDFMDKGAANRVGSIYGRPVTQAEALKGFRHFEAARMLQLNRLIKVLGGVPDQIPESMLSMYRLPDDIAENFVWNTMVLRHEAEQLGIVPTAAEIEQAIMNLPAFRTNDVYDSSKYNLFVANALAPRGMTADALEQIVADDLRVERIKAVLGTTVVPSASELRAIFEMRSAKFETQVVRWKYDDFIKDAQVSDDDVKTAYEERKTTLKTDEQRKVKFVAFTLPNVEKPLVGKERTDLLGRLSTKAEDFSVAMTEKDAQLDAVAAKIGATVQETAAFTAAVPPAELGQEHAVAAAAFRLTKEQPNSDPIQTDKGYYVIQLAEIIPSREQTLDEARVKLAEALKNERATETMTLKATEARNKIEAALKAGKSFADAATAAGVTAEVIPPFSLSEPPGKEADANEIRQAVSDLDPGQLSAFQATGAGDKPSGGFLVFLEKKQPIDEAKFAQEKPMLTEQFGRALRDATMQQWIKQRRAAANIQSLNRIRS
jgi:peptidyl-prolyl cis-trans isomerase D